MSLIVYEYEATFDQNRIGKTLQPFSDKINLPKDSKIPALPDECIKKKKDILQKFNPDNSIWITTDIKSKVFILNQLKLSDINTNSVMRARDFWSALLHQAYPEHHIIEQTVLTFIYSEWAKSKKQQWQQGLETGKFICKLMSKIAHLLQHPLRESLMEEWIKTFSQNNSYEKAWHNLAVDFWSYLEQKKIIESSWASALLLDNLPFNKGSFSLQERLFTNIIFDLGFNTNKVESELIHQITSRIHTTVLIPFCFDEKQQKNIASLYGWINKTFSKTQKPPTPPTNSLKIKKFATPLSEVKDITHQIKKALKEGINFDKISVLAPNIEDYWICLKSYLQKENIPVNKVETVSLVSFPVIQLWLAKLWTHLSILKPEYLHIIRSHQSLYTNFSQLKTEFCNIKEIEKWPKWVYEKSQLREKNELISYEDFIKWAKDLLPNVPSVIRKPLKECLNEFSKNKSLLKTLPLKRQAWLSLLEHHISIKEIEIKSGQPNGINCLSFNAIDWVESDLIYIAGLSEQNLKNEKQRSLSALEAQSITRDLGFFIKTDPIDKTENIISCFIHQKHNKNLILSFSTSNFLGEALNPSCLWLENAMQYRKENINHFDTPGLSLWDEQQRKPTVKEIFCDDIDPVQQKLLEQSLLEDTGNKVAEPFFQKGIKSLSPSSLENYIKCPFIFATKKMFCLWEGPERDMDIPALEKGSFIHKLFEALQLKLNPLKIISPEKESNTNENSNQKENLLSEQEILQIIEDIKNHDPFKRSLQKIHPLIWEKEKSRLFKKALIFLKQETKRDLLFKNYRTLACEKEYNCYWSFKTESLSKEGDILFTGKIDRIDSDQQSYQIIDYKGSLPTGSIASSWEKQKNFQMAFYIQVLEQGLASLPALPVKSGFYLSYKNFEYQGMALKEPSYIELLGSPKKRSLVSEQQKQMILEKVNKQINALILNIQAGLFPAKPKTKTTCEKCQWRKICRAPHLN